jgi:glutamine synthetase
MKTILEQLKRDNVKFVELQFSDIFGTLKSVTVAVEAAETALSKGKWFDGSSIKGFARIMESDFYLKPDLKTYAILQPVDEELKTARFLCDTFTPDGKPYPGDPRFILKKAVQEAIQLGYTCLLGPEIEFFLLKSQPGSLAAVPHDIGGYFDCSTRDKASDLRKKIMIAMNTMKLNAEFSHHEVAIGQHELGFRYGEAIEMADKVITLKHIVKSMATLEGIQASFMPKPFFGINGSGMHVHFSLVDLNDNPVFYDNNGQYKLSKTAQYFIAGIMAHIKEICVLLAPTVNSYKRLVPGYEAPVYICWGQANRSALIRIPRPFENNAKSIRAELRCPDPSCNPYLAFAAIIKAGLEGIKKQELISPSIEENVYKFDETKREKHNIQTLPENLGHALECFKNSTLMREFLGEDFFIKYYEAKKKEWDEFRLQVTEWEQKRYLEVS